MEDDAPAGVPEWVVTYGDMMSLLLTFFIMLVSLSEVKAEQKYRAILDSLQRYVGYRNAPAAPPGENFPLNSLIARLETLGGHTEVEPGRGGVKTRAVPGKDTRVFRTREGTSLRVAEPIDFAPGSAELSEAARGQLREIAAELAGKPNKIEICTAADSQTALLAYERARSVWEFLKRLGVATERMRITAIAQPGVEASAAPAAPGVDMAVGEHQAEVRILDAYAADFVGPREITP